MPAPEYRCSFCERYESGSPYGIERHWETCPEYQKEAKMDEHPQDLALKIARLQEALEERGVEWDEIIRIGNGVKSEWYDVCIYNTFVADSPQDAVKQMRDWLVGESASGTYRVQNTNTKQKYFVDSDDDDTWPGEW